MKKKDQPPNIEDKIDIIQSMNSKGYFYLRGGGSYLGIPLEEFPYQGLAGIILKLSDEISYLKYKYERKG